MNRKRYIIRISFLLILVFFPLNINAFIPDPGFDGDGIFKHHNAAGGNGDDRSYGIVIDASGRYLITGQSDNSGGNYDMVLWRINPGGSLDTTFNSKGWVTHHNAAGGGTYDMGSAVAVDSTGRIVVAGGSIGTGWDMAVWRFNPDGAFDTNFGTNGGWVTHNNAGGGNSHDIGYDVAIDTNGRIFIAGYSDGGATDDMALWCFASNGTLDTNFGTNKGWVTHHNAAGGNANDQGYAVAIDTIGRILVAGESGRAGNNYDMTIWRYNPDGSLDTTFSNKGWVTHHNAAGAFNNDVAEDIFIDANDKILTTGYSDGSGTDKDMVIWRFNPDGSRDLTFNSNNGWIVHHNAAGGVGYDRGYGITVNSDGKVLVSGTSLGTGGMFDGEMVIWRYNANGTLDTTFSNKGWIVNDCSSAGTGNSGQDIITDSSGKILVAGMSAQSLGTFDMVIWKFYIPPTSPGSGTAVTASHTQIDLTWDDVSFETSYTLYRNLSNDTNTCSSVAGLPADTTDYSDKGLKPANTYYYWIKAYNAQGSTAFSSIGLATTLQDPADSFTIRTVELTPNPFNPYRNLYGYITFFNMPDDVRITVYDVLNNKLRELSQPDSDHRIVWDVKDKEGKDLPRGVYILHLEDGNGKSRIMKLVIQR
ncbi:MAG: SBBP repeat-containing protein [Spirochaetes bacterium]|nr:SBBP repeat-containing protein [Spirochaetota bacterium]